MMGWGADWPDDFGFLSQIADSRVIRDAIYVALRAGQRGAGLDLTGYVGDGQGGISRHPRHA